MQLRSTSSLDEIRLAVALSHCLPDCNVELADDAGGTLVVGFGDGAAVTPCAACGAVAAAMRTFPSRLGTLLGLRPGCPRVRLLDEEVDDAHVGLGVYRYRDEAAWGYVFATLVAPADVRAVVADRSAERLEHGVPDELLLVRVGEWRMSFDDGIAVTVCSSRYPIGASTLLAHAERLALDVAGACLVDEVTA